MPFAIRACTIQCMHSPVADGPHPTRVLVVDADRRVRASLERLITVADFKGRKILNYRFSRVNFATQGGAKFGMGPEGTDEFECGGIMEFPGQPFCISATNAN